MFAQKVDVYNILTCTKKMICQIHTLILIDVKIKNKIAASILQSHFSNN